MKHPNFVKTLTRNFNTPVPGVLMNCQDGFAKTASMGMMVWVVLFVT